MCWCCVMKNSRPDSPPNKEYVTPTENDILCGRGRAAYGRPANQKLRVKVFELLEEYKSSTRTGKTGVIRGIIAELTQDGGRFLKYDVDTQQWYDGGIDAAKGRIGAAMRDAATPDKVKYIGKLGKARRSAACTTKEQEDEKTAFLPAQPIGPFAAAQLPPLSMSAPLDSTIVPFSESSQYHKLRQENPWVEESMARLQSPFYQEEASARKWLPDIITPAVTLSSDYVVREQEAGAAPQHNASMPKQPTVQQRGSQEAEISEQRRERDQALMSHIVMFNATRGAGLLPTSSLDPAALKRRIAEFNASRGIVLASLRSGGSGGGVPPPHQSNMYAGSVRASMSVPDDMPWPPHRSTRTNSSASGRTSSGIMSPVGELFYVVRKHDDEEASFFTAMPGDRLDSTGTSSSSRSNSNHNTENAGAGTRGETMTATTRRQSTASSVFSFSEFLGLMQDQEGAADDDDEASFFTAALDDIECPPEDIAKTTSFESLKEFP